MLLPDSLKSDVEQAADITISSAGSIGGGSINQAAKIETEAGQTYFLKWNASAPADMFWKEKQGLELLASAETGLRIPSVRALNDSGRNDFLLIDFIQKRSGSSSSNQKFGRQLASLHQVKAENYGLDYDNYIGRLPQSNARYDNWIDFFINERLQPQLKQALDKGKISQSVSNNFQQLYKKLPELLPEEPPSLLHGDLWSGNYFYDEAGAAAIFDPAVYYGNREIEIAFTHLFGGFSSAFYAAYQEAFPLKPNFNKRKDIYNLYPLLVHTNMFGGHYGRQVASLVKRF